MQRSRWAAPMVFAGVLLILASIGWLSSVLADWEQANGSHRLRKLTATVDRSVTAPETAGLTLKEAEQLAAKWAPLPIAYSARVQTRATLGGVSANCEVFGVNGSYRDFTEVRLKTGTSFAPASVDEHSRVAVIGAKVADELFHSERVAGKTIKLFGVPFTIIGVMDDEGSLLRQMADDGIPDVLIPVTALLDLRPEARIEGIQLAARPSAVLRGETDAGDVLRAIGKNAAHFRIENHLVTHMQIGQLHSLLLFSCGIIALYWLTCSIGRQFLAVRTVLQERLHALDWNDALLSERRLLLKYGFAAAARRLRGRAMVR
ncbi:ABC transporter permease [Paenibacillus sp. P25]|nr:ABC transporter permease [Paenibacillus sp. P25]